MKVKPLSPGRQPAYGRQEPVGMPMGQPDSSSEASGRRNDPATDPQHKSIPGGPMHNYPKPSETTGNKMSRMNYKPHGVQK